MIRTGPRSGPERATARRAATDEELAIDGNRAAGPAGATAPRAKRGAKRTEFAPGA